MVVAVAAFSLAAALIVLLPGPDTLIVVRELVRDGRRRAVQTVVGVLCGLSIWVATAAFGRLLLIAGQPTRWVADARIRRRLNATAGVVLIGLGVRLAVEQ